MGALYGRWFEVVDLVAESRSAITGIPAKAYVDLFPGPASSMVGSPSCDEMKSVISDRIEQMEREAPDGP
tara:strand:- start:9873 stop:10082 length:210 start_codon:yes stop_codon:yes gene_type:complete